MPLVRASSTASPRNAGGYGGCVFAIVDSFLEAVGPSIPVSTQRSQAQDFPLPPRIRAKAAVTGHLPTGFWGQRHHQGTETPAVPHA